MFFEDVRVPADQLVGEENQGWTYAKFLLGNERTGIARLGLTKLWMSQVKEHAAQVQTERGDAAGGSAVRSAGCRDRERAAGPGTDADAGQRFRGRTASRTPRRRYSSCADSQLQQAATELLVEVAGPDALPFDAGAELDSPVWAQRRRPPLPQLPQDLDLRRHQRGAAHDHRLDHPGIVSRSWTST